MSKPAPQPEHPRDPLFIHARRELWVTLLVWLLFGVWVLAVSWLSGPSGQEAAVATVWGMPAWVFWGVGVPWVAANLVTFWFCFRFMADDPLEEVPEEQDEPTGEPS